MESRVQTVYLGFIAFIQNSWLENIFCLLWMATAKRQFLLLPALCARNAVDCLLFLLRLAAKLGPRWSFSQPCRSGRRSTRYSRNNLGVAARNFAALKEHKEHSCCCTSGWCCLHLGSLWQHWTGTRLVELLVPVQREGEALLFQITSFHRHFCLHSPNLHFPSHSEQCHCSSGLVLPGTELIFLPVSAVEGCEWGAVWCLAACWVKPPPIPVFAYSISAHLKFLQAWASGQRVDFMYHSQMWAWLPCRYKSLLIPNVTEKS